MSSKNGLEKVSMIFGVNITSVIIAPASYQKLSPSRVYVQIEKWKFWRIFFSNRDLNIEAMAIKLLHVLIIKMI